VKFVLGILIAFSSNAKINSRKMERKIAEWNPVGRNETWWILLKQTALVSHQFSKGHYLSLQAIFNRLKIFIHR
jgi:hypothetical protein